MNTKKITHKGKLYAIYFNVSEAEDGLSFISEDGDFIQVGIWKYQPKKTLPAHFHKEYIREATRTCESVYVVKGKIKCNLYTKSGNFIESFILNNNDMAIQLYGVHEYEILEEALVIENKNGPYFGPEIDRKRINVQKN
tara:strand:+ start:9412 stop:9828 length:417 start_codon:yes stop_codon:yes gene_type:complete